MRSIGIDIGTTTICGIRMCIDNGVVEKSITRQNASEIKSENKWEKLQDPDIIYQIVFEIIEELYADNICSVGISGQMHGILYTDRNGMAKSPLYTWQDCRGDLPYKNTTYSKYINVPSGYGEVTHFYNKENGLIPDGAFKFCSIGDYIAMRLSENTEPIVHCSNAASFGLYDIKEYRFINEDKYHPEITNGFDIVGKWREIPVSVAIGDNQASFIGCGADDKTVLVNMGTGSQISFIMDDINKTEGLEIRPLFDDKYIAVGSSLCGGRAYAALEKFFRQVLRMAGYESDSLYDEMYDEVLVSYKTDLAFNTLFCGTRSNPDTRASISNISLDNFTPGNIIQSCMIGMAKELYDMYKNTSGGCTRLVVSGNGVRKNPALKIVIEDIFGLKALLPENCEEASFGAMLFSLKAVGEYKEMKEAERMIRYDI